MRVIFQSERWFQISDEIKPLLKLHWGEVANHRASVPLDPDWEMYDRLDRTAVLMITTARDDGKLVGYYLSHVTPHPHYKSTLYAFVDVYFLLPEYRNGNTGIRLFMAMEEAMRARMKTAGRTKMVLIGRGRLAHNPQAILERLGWKAVETAYTKLLEA